MTQRKWNRSGCSAEKVSRAVLTSVRQRFLPPFPFEISASTLRSIKRPAGHWPSALSGIVFTSRTP